MRAAHVALLAILLAGFGVSCSSSSGPSDVVTEGGSCATDLSCPFGEECNGAACAPIKPALRSHIQTASCLLRPPLDSGELAWRASHYDLLISGFRADEARAVNPNVRLFDYVLVRFNRFDRPAPKTASQWASANGYDGEDFYLHYREDTAVPTWEGREIVPGYPAGTVPGWNPGGGGNPASAASRDHSRVVGYYQGTDPWYLANMGHPGYREFVAHYVAGLIDGTWWYNQPYASGPLDGVLIDDAIWYPMFGEGLLDHSTEYYGVPINDDHPYTYAIETQFPELSAEMRDRFSSTRDIMPNYGHVLFLNYPNRCAQKIQETTPWIWGEVWVTYTGTSSPTTGGNRCITYERDYANGVREIIAQTRAGGRRIVGARDMSSGSAGTDRGRLFTLGLYYLLHNAHAYYMYETIVGHMDPANVAAWAWNPAVEADVGQPDQVPPGMVDYAGKANTKEHYVFATGPDPYNNSLTYRVLARNFTNALVLVKMLPEGSVVDDQSITVHALDGPYAPLLADGTVGPLITQASIRNNEALILLK